MQYDINCNFIVAIVKKIHKYNNHAFKQMVEVQKDMEKCASQHASKTVRVGKQTPVTIKFFYVEHGYVSNKF